MLMKKCFLCWLILITLHAAAQQYAPVTIPGSEKRSITSAIVKGQEYELQILLPGGYKTSNKKYPVVYIMDAQWDFPLLKSIYGQQYYDGFIPEVILCGVTWGGTNPNPDSLRVRDYTPTNDGQRMQGGGADNFLSFMEKELFPFMEANYKVSDERNLVGCSLGGLFTVYAMFTHTRMFTGYAAASPAVGWDKEVMLNKFESDFAKKKIEKPVRLYMTVGDVESSRPQYERFAKQLTGKKYNNVSVVSKILENTGHSGTKSETYNRGLQFIYQRNKLALSNEWVKKYTGLYQLPNGSTIELKQQADKLVLSAGTQNNIELFANTTQHLYAVHEFFNMYFKEVNGTVEGFNLVRYGSEVFIKKINN
jgi:predicted alpha/beta superfamily hydrolase